MNKVLGNMMLFLGEYPCLINYQNKIYFLLQITQKHIFTKAKKKKSNMKAIIVRVHYV